MLYVLEMATDPDIVATHLGNGWPAPLGRSHWARVQNGGQDIPAASTLIVIAHGNGHEIGNARPGQVDVTPEGFLALIHNSMAHGAAPGEIYLSTCGNGIAQFTAAVRLAAGHNQVWRNTRLFGHHDPQAGPVPPPRDVRWTQIF